MRWAGIGFFFLLVKLKNGSVYLSSGLVASLTLLQLNMPLAPQLESLCYCSQKKNPRGGRFVTWPSLPPSGVCLRPSHGALDMSPEEGSLQATRLQRTSAWHADAYQPIGRGVH